MSTPTQLIEQIQVATNYQKNKQLLREKILVDLHFVYNNGLFKASPEIFSFVTNWPDHELYVEDVYQTPILVNRAEFLELCKQHYHMVMNQWHIQHEELKRVRKI